MSMKSLIKFMLNSPLRLLLRLDKSITETFRAGFVSTAISEGVYDTLKEDALSVDKIAEDLGISNLQGLEAWLDMGVSLGELSKIEDKYSIKGALSRGLLDRKNDTWQAFLQARIEVINDYITQTPAKLKNNTLFEFSSDYGVLFARSSRTVEPVLLDVIKENIPKDEPLRLLEVGCGSGIYLKYVCDINSRLNATGIELQSNVAEFAAKNMVKWNLHDRVTIENVDIRQYKGEHGFDLITFYNLIYYFPLNERLDILKILASNLNSNGRLFMTTLCRLKSPSIESMNLWSSMTKGCGPLPEKAQMIEMLSSAGFENIKVKQLIPGFFVFKSSIP